MLPLMDKSSVAAVTLSTNQLSSNSAFTRTASGIIAPEQRLVEPPMILGMLTRSGELF